MQYAYRLTAAIIACACGAVLPSPAGASGFYIQEQSVSGLGTAFAGAVADTQDASTIFYNPAGMTALDRAQFVAGTNIISPNFEFKNNGSSVSTTVGTGGGTVALSGGTGGDPFPTALVPNIYLAAPLSANKRLWAGIGISAPFGLANEYNDDFVGRYDSTENVLKIIDVAPSLAYAVTPWLSLGFGLDVQYADAKLETAVPSPITAGGPVPGTDGMTDLSGKDTTMGFNTGAIIAAGDNTRIGLHYRQGVSHTLQGRLITRVPSDVPGVGGTVSRVDGGAELDLPNMVSTGISHKMNDKLTLLGSVNWTEWSNFDDIPVQLANGTFSQSEQNYKNTWSFAAGARYQATPDLELKAGLQFDATPSVDGFRSTRVPDGDRTWVSGGAAYKLSNSWVLDLAATYVDVSEEDINLTHTVAIGANSTTSTLQGSTEGSVGIFSAALRYNFDTPY